MRVIDIGAYVRYQHPEKSRLHRQDLDGVLGRVTAVRTSLNKTEPFAVCVSFIGMGNEQLWCHQRDLDLISEREYMTVLASFALGVAPGGTDGEV